MAAIQSIIDRLQAKSDAIKEVPATIIRTVKENEDILLSLNKDQLLLGRNTKGDSLSPNYLEDPYFKTKQAAEAYARMKDALLPMHMTRLWNPQLYTDKPRLTPNLIVRGDFQDAMYITTGSNVITIGSSYKDASNINAKYNNLVFGIAEQSNLFFYREYLRTALIQSLNAV